MIAYLQRGLRMNLLRLCLDLCGFVCGCVWDGWWFCVDLYGLRMDLLTLTLTLTLWISYGFVWNRVVVYGFVLICVWNLCGLCVCGFVVDFSNCMHLCMDLLWIMRGCVLICVEFVWSCYGFCVDCVWIPYGI
jgi:hypothetical protein